MEQKIEDIMNVLESLQNANERTKGMFTESIDIIYDTLFSLEEE